MQSPVASARTLTKALARGKPIKGEPVAGPDVSVILPVFNAKNTVARSVESLLQDDQVNAEFILIDDGSNDGSDRILAGYNDPRTRLFSQENMGLAMTLNRGISLARGRYIARLDADDISLPGRLLRQFRFLENNTNVALVGTWAEIYVGDEPSGRFHRHPADPCALKLELLVDNPFVHASVMMRADVVRSLGGYRVERSTRFPEDYDLWSRISEKYKVANLPEVLTIYREVPGSITRLGRGEILANVARISARNIGAVLDTKGGEDDYLSFAMFYHGLADPIGEGLSPFRLFSLWRDAAASIGGPSSKWTPEYRTVYLRVRRNLRSRIVQRHLPAGVLTALRSAKSRFARR